MLNKSLVKYVKSLVIFLFRKDGPCGVVQMSSHFILLLTAHKLYIGHLSNSWYHFIKENYTSIIIALSPSPTSETHEITVDFSRDK